MLYPMDTFHNFMARQQLLIQFFVASVDCYMDMEAIQIGEARVTDRRGIYLLAPSTFILPLGG